MSTSETAMPHTAPARNPNLLLAQLPPKAQKDTRADLPDNRRVFYVTGQRDELIRRIWLDEGEQAIEALDERTLKAGDATVHLDGDFVSMSVCFSGTTDSRAHIPLEERRFYVHCGLVVQGKFTISQPGQKTVTAPWMIVDRRWNGVSMQFCHAQTDCWEHFTEFELAGEAVGLRSDCVVTTAQLKAKLNAKDVAQRLVADWGREFIHLAPDEILEAVLERHDMTNCTVYVVRCAIAMVKDPQLPIMEVHSAYHRMAKHLTRRLDGMRARL